VDEPDLFADATAARTPRATVPAAGASAGTLPPLAVRMLRIGEQSGELAALAYKVAEFYELRLERSLSRLVGFVGPAAVTLISVLIGGMIVSMMSTLMSFNDMVR